jgi:LysM repeat protein
MHFNALTALLSLAFAAPVPAGVYTVKSGDTLSKIASTLIVENGLEETEAKKWEFITEIQELNDIVNVNIIYVGQKIVLPGVVATSEATASEVSAVPTLIHDTIYTVTEGDDMWSIAATLIAEEGLEDTDVMRWAIVGKIKDLNEIEDVNVIYVGQKIVLPVYAYESVGIHTVVKGEFLFGIAEGYETTVEVLCALNDIVDPDFIIPGQEIRYPMKGE